jgi:LmbE family N-acetylglucosaminyl deacetylase
MKQFYKILVLVLINLPVLLWCQETSSELYAQLKALGNTQTVLYVAAHPDDENTRLLTWLSRSRGVRTAYLSLTRGEGGQNFIGKEQGQALGILRTQELLAARKIDGAEQYFTRAYDFGYSKNAEETFSHWNRDSLLFDIVWVIRWLQPDVVICRFPTTGEGGHGHHTASAILTLEAVKMAANPWEFPEQLRWVTPWNCPRVLWNTFNFGGLNTIDSSQFRVDVGDYLPLFGQSVGELAAESRSQHRSQAFGTEKKRQTTYEFFKTMAGSVPVTDILDHVAGGWARFPGLEFVDKTLTDLRVKFDFEKPEKIVPELLSLRTEITARLNGKDVRSIPAIIRFRLEQWDELVLKLCGVYTEIVSPVPKRAANQQAILSLFSVNRSFLPVRLISLSGWGFEKEYSVQLHNNLPFRDTLSYSSIWQEVITQPYDYHEREPVRVYLPREMDASLPLDTWLEKAEWEAYAPVFHLPEYRPESACSLTYEILRHRIVHKAQIQFKKVDPARGEIYTPLVIGPALTLFSEKPFLYIPSGGSVRLGLKVSSNAGLQKGWARLLSTGNVFVTPDSIFFTLQEGKDTTLYFFLTAPRSARDSSFYIYPEALVDGIFYRLTERVLEYEHIPGQVVYEPLAIPACVVRLSRKWNTHTCLFVEGAGDQTDEALRQLGFQVLVWRRDAAWPGPLSVQRYSLVVTGVRALNLRQDLQPFWNSLEDYVKEGGIVLFQYNTLQDAHQLQSMMPGSLRLSRRRITDEKAPVYWLDANDLIWHCPLELSLKDFDGWVQERALYVPESWGTEWKPLLESSDKEESLLKGLLLVRRSGKGRMMYSSLTFFRQLPAAVPGAVRLFYNLCSPALCKADAGHRKRPSSAKEK